MENDYQKWVITRAFALKILSAALNSLEKKEDFVVASRMVEKLLCEYSQSLHENNVKM